jgi:hypothetical protein
VLVLLLTPSAKRAQTATAAVAESDAPIAVEVWSQHSTDSALATVLNAEQRLRHNPDLVGSSRESPVQDVVP